MSGKNGTYRRVLDRRTFLRGAGTVAIGLPFLAEMRRRSAYAETPPLDPRVLTFFFGLGIPSQYQVDAFAAPFAEHLAPLARVQDKVAMIRGVHYEKGSRTTGNHARGSTTAFIGGRQSGASIDQVVLQEHYRGRAPTPVQTIVAGTFTRQDRNQRHIHSWAAAGVPTDSPIESPTRLFDRTFGSFMPVDLPPDEPSEMDRERARQARYERSILDAALEQYRHVTSDAFGLSAESKAKVRLHIERVRELELRIFDPDAPMDMPPVGDPSCPGATDPGAFTHPEMVEIQRTVNNEGVRMEVNRWMELWHAMVEVVALAYECDLTRIASLQLTSGGERIRLYGDYTAYGQTRSFDDDLTTHEYWHRLRPDSEMEDKLLDHTWFYMAELTYLLERLDEIELDDSGTSLLDAGMVLATTELGNGRTHDIEDVFHLVGRTNGCLRTGVLDVDRQATEVYNACLRAVGVDDRDMDGDDRWDGDVATELLT